MARLRDEFDIDVTYTHFPLHPKTPHEGTTLEKLFAGRNIDIAASQRKMARLMAEEGLPYGERTMTYNSRMSQELAQWAILQEGGEAIHDALFRAYFVDGTNIALVDNLVSIAKSAGLDGEQAREALVSRAFCRAVDADWDRSRMLGVTGVPTFAVGRRAVAGAQSYEVLASLLTDCGAPRRATA